MVDETNGSSVDLKIYVVTHKPTIVPAETAFIPIQAGAASAPAIGILRDDTGDNISSKNACYSELTAHYWIWKNQSSEYVGLVHYRRYFSAALTEYLHLGKEIANSADIASILYPKLFLVARPFHFYHSGSSFPQSLEQQYMAVHGYEIVFARRAIADLASSYLPTFDFIMRNNRLYAFNLLITSRFLFSEYCSWVFPILFAVEESLNMEARSDYSARVCAFLSERLFTTWMIHNDKQIGIEERDHVFYAGL